MNPTKDTALGVIPDEWETCPIGAFAQAAQYGLSVRGEATGRYPILRMNCQLDGQVVFRNLQYVDLDQRTFETFRLKRGDILFNRTNSFELVGRSAIYNDDAPAVFASYLVRLSVDRSRVDPSYLNFLLNWDVAQIELKKLASRGVSQANISASKLQTFLVHLPTLSEQADIAKVLTEVRRLMEREQELIANLAALKNATVRQLFSQGLHGEAQKETEFGGVPDSWCIETLDHCAEVQTGVTKGRKLDGSNIIEVPYLRVANVQDGHLDLSEMKSIPIRSSEIDRYRLHVGDIVLTEGGDFDKLGRGFIWRGELDLCIHQNHVFAVRPDRRRLLPEFFAYLSQSPYGKAYFLQVAHKTTNLASINVTKLKAFPVLIPTIDEQREIVSVLEAVDRKIDLHKRKRSVIEELFRTLLNKLMTGEIRVSDLDRSMLAPAEEQEAAA